MKTMRAMLMSLLVLIIVASSAFSSASIVAAADEDNVFYVSSNGDDGNSGAKEAPFASIGKALEKVASTGTIVLLSDITLNQKLSIAATGKTVTIQSDDGNTYSIIRNTTFTNDNLIDISGGTITFQNLIIDGNNVETPKMGVTAVGGTVTVFENVEVRNHFLNTKGGSGFIVFASGATVTIKEGTTVHDNKVMGMRSDNPPAVLGAGSGGVLEIQGGVITNNTISNGNGVIVGVGLSGSPRFQMTAGKITGNILSGTELAAGETVGNVAVYMRGTAAQAKFEFGGTAYVYDNLNTTGEQRNVFLKNQAAQNSAYLTLVRTMEQGAKVGVYARIMPDEINNQIVDIAIGGSSYQAQKIDADYFVSDINTTAAIAYEDSSHKIILTYRKPVNLELKEPSAGQAVGTQPTVSGTGTPEAKLTVTLVSKADPSKSITGEATVKEDGTWEFTPSTKLAPGDYTLKVTAVKDGVSAGPVTRELTVVDKDDLREAWQKIDGQIKDGELQENAYTADSWKALQDALKEAQAVLSNENATQEQVDAALTKLTDAYKALEKVPSPVVLTVSQPTDGTLSTARPVFAGTATPGSTVTVKVAEGITLTTKADENGNWSVTPDVDLPNGDYTVKVTAEKDGNVSGEVTKTIKVDTTTPEVPSVEVTAPTGTVNTSKPEFKGTATPGAKVTVKVTDEITLTATADENGNWSVTPDVDLPNGDYTVKVTAEKDGKASEEVTKAIKVDAANPSGLTGLKLNSWNGDSIGLSPAFNESTTSYTVSVTNSVYAVTTLPTAHDPNAKIEVSVNGGAMQTIKNGEASNLLQLNVGTNKIIVKVTDEKGKVTEYTLTVTRASNNDGNNGNNGNNNGGSNNGGGSSGGSTTTPTAPTTPVTPTKPDGSGIETSVNGKDNPFATGKTSTSGDGKQTEVQVNPGKLNDALSQGTGQKLAIRSPENGDLKVDGLTAESVKQLVDKNASLEISNPLAIYPVPGGKMDLGSVSKQLGNAALNDIAVHIDIKRSSDALVNNAKNKATAQGYELLVNPVDLDLTFTNNGKTARSGELKGYTPKYIALPEGIDPNRITTGVIVNPDGSIFHVPTVVTKINGRYYAQINDLRGHGSYSVIWNPQDFADVKTHWGKADVNNIAARLDLEGTGSNTFSPNRNVTRSEFADIVVLGLGLMRQDAQQNIFPDIPDSAWYRTSVALANEYGIVRGYNDGKFYGNQEITREQGFAMIARAYRFIDSQATLSEEQAASALARYNDAADVAAWAKPDVAQLIAAGIIQGNGPEVLSPKAPMTRAEVTALTARMLKITDMIDK